MATLSSSSTIDEIKASYADNASYEEDGSVTKAKAFITACRILLLRIPRLSAQDRAQIQMAPELIQQEMRRASDFVASNPAAGSTTGRGTVHYSIQNLRD